jgi:hypothetical protein
LSDLDAVRSVPRRVNGSLADAQNHHMNRRVQPRSAQLRRNNPASVLSVAHR